jgi:hypothetical protein
MDPVLELQLPRIGQVTISEPDGHAGKLTRILPLDAEMRTALLGNILGNPCTVREMSSIMAFDGRRIVARPVSYPPERRYIDILADKLLHSVNLPSGMPFQALYGSCA